MPIINSVRPAIVETYYASANVTIPFTDRIYILCQGGGGASGTRTSPVEGSGGGGGGFLIHESYINGEDIGQTSNLSITINNGSVENNGGNVIVTASLNGNTNIRLFAQGGQKGQTFTDGVGGPAANGNILNIPGNDGYGFVHGPSGEEAPGFGGEPGGWSWYINTNYVGFLVSEDPTVTNGEDLARRNFDPAASQIYQNVNRLGRGADGRFTGDGVAGEDGYVMLIYYPF